MKSLTLFLIISLVFSCYINTIEQTKNTNKNNEKKKQNKNSFAIPSQKKELTLTKGDLEVCNTGKNLGLLDVGTTCSYKYSNYCEKIIKREKNLPPQSKYKQAKLASAALKDSKKSVNVALKKKKKWTLKSRTDKFRKKKSNKGFGKFGKKLSKAEKKKKEKLKILRKEANHVANKIFSKAKSLKVKSKQNLKKDAKRTLNKIISGNMKAARKSLNLPPVKKVEKKTISLTKKLDQDKGKYCVHSVVWNLSHCCYFASRIEAQNFANTQPIEPVFQRKMIEGWHAQLKDNKKNANKVINKTTDAIKVFEKKRQENKKLINSGKNVSDRKKGKKGKKASKSKKDE